MMNVGPVVTGDSEVHSYAIFSSLFPKADLNFAREQVLEDL